MAPSNSNSNNKAKVPKVPAFPPTPTQPQLSYHARRLSYANHVLKSHPDISSADTNLIRDLLNIAFRKTVPLANAELTARSAALLLKTLCIGLLLEKDTEGSALLLDESGVMEKMNEIEKRGDPTEGDIEGIRNQIELAEEALEKMMVQ